MTSERSRDSASPHVGQSGRFGNGLDLAFLSGVAGLVASQLGVTSAFVAHGAAEPDAFLVVVAPANGGAAGDPTALVEPVPLRLDKAALKPGEPVVIEDTARDDRTAAKELAAAFPGHQSFVVVPIGQADGAVAGILGAGHDEPRTFSKRELDLIVRAARMVRLERAAPARSETPDADDPSHELVGTVPPTGERMLAAVTRVLVTGEAETLSIQLEHPAAAEQLEVRFEPQRGGDVLTVVPDEQHDAAVRSERQLLQTLIDLLPEQIFIKDIESRFTRVNKTILADFGLREMDQIIGKTDFDFFPEAVAREFFAQEQELLVTGQPLLDRVENQALPGRGDHWRRTSKIPIRNRSGQIIGLVGSSWDVTATLAHERALAQLAALVEWSNDAIIGLDRHGRIASWNPAAERLFGYTEAEIVGQDYLLLVPRDQSMILLDDLVNKANEDDYVGGLETRRRRKDGSEVEVEVKASLIRDDAGDFAGVSVIMREIGERKAAEARLRELELRYRTFVEQMPGVTYITSAVGDSEILPLFHLSQRFEEWLGYPISEWERDPHFSFQLIHSDDRDRVRKHDSETTATGEPYRAEYRMSTKDGRTIWVRDEAVLVHDDQGRPLYWLGFIFDITDLKRAEAEVTEALARERAANRELERANTAKSEIVSMISHEFRTPLTSIQGYSELLVDENLTPEEIRSFATTINANARRLARMIRDVLDLERLESGRMDVNWSEVDLNEITDDVIASLRSTTTRHLFVTRFDPDLPLVPGDRDLLTQVVTNLLANAIKYSPHGGEIALATVRHPDAVELIVRDHGLGIPPDALESIFFRYSRIERPAQRHIEGTGLGLPIARQIADLHGGSIWAESDGADGSEFHVRLPA